MLGQLELSQQRMWQQLLQQQRRQHPGSWPILLNENFEMQAHLDRQLFSIDQDRGAPAARTVPRSADGRIL